MPLVLVSFTFPSFRRFLPTFKQSISGSLWSQIQMAMLSTKTQALIPIYEESKELWEDHRETRNPVIESSEFAYKVDQLARREFNMFE